jgi:hypothetical protein
VSVINDKIGPTHENTISADLSYTIPTSEKLNYLFGIKATANLFDLMLQTESVDDDLVCMTIISSPLLGLRVYLHSDKAYVGLSIPNFIESNRYDNSSYF